MKQRNITLRAMEPEDLEELYNIENDRGLWDVGATNVPYSRYSLHQYIASSNNDIYADRQMRLIIQTAEGTMAGIIDLYNYDPRHNRAEVGVVVKPEYRNHGLAKEALDELHRYACDVLDIYQLYAVVAATNDRSLHLFKSQGYESTATLRHWLHEKDGYQDAIVLQKKIKK